MGIDVETNVTVRCDGCRKRCDEGETFNHCRACEGKRKAEQTPARGSEIRSWADRQRLLGLITQAEFEFLERVAKDVDLTTPAKPTKQEIGALAR